MNRVIDIKKILRDKNSKLERWIPGFVVNYLKRIFHQDEINEILHETADIRNYDNKKGLQNALQPLW